MKDLRVFPLTKWALILCILCVIPIRSDAAGQLKPIKEVKPPKGAIVLFDGKNTDAWEQLSTKGACQWLITDGNLEVNVGAGNIITKRLFRDYHLHLEFMEPYMPDQTSQGKGNSGVYNLGQYEIQVLDSYNNPTYKNGCCGSIYGFKEPDKSMSRPPLQWQSYDIFFHAPRLDESGKVVKYPRVTLIWNGVKVQNNVEITCGPTTASMGGPVLAEGPIMLQDHGCPVKFRNIWIQELKK